MGQKVKQILDDGILVSDEIVVELIDDQLNQNAGAPGFIYDGFPRTVGQAEALDKLLQGRGTKVDSRHPIGGRRKRAIGARNQAV